MTPTYGPLRFADRLRKLRAMSPDELWTRVRYDAYCRVERTRQGRSALGSAGRLQRALVPRLSRADDWRGALLESRTHRTARFFAGVERREAIRGLFSRRYARERQCAVLLAERAARHEFSFFGHTFRYNGRIDWHADPETGAPWPRLYHRDVPVNGGDVGFGDVKYVWELGRHQFLIDLSRAWALERAPTYPQVVRQFVSDWRAENPIGVGVGWSCALEPAFRVLSWLWAYFLTLDDPRFDRDAHIAWLEGFHDHGWFLYRHLEYYSSPFNHLAGEASALYCLGVLFPEFEESGKWRTLGRDVLESRLPRQFYADGGSVEQSTFYHHATTGFYLIAALLGRQNGEEFSPAVWSAIERAIEFSMLLQQPDGTTPPIGGADDGKPIRLEELPLWDFRPYQSTGAVLFQRSDFKCGAAGRFYEDALWLLGPDGLAEFDRLPSVDPEPPSRVLRSSGYVVFRNKWSPDADFLCFDCGEQAGGLRRDDIPSAAHGHADCLSLVLWRRGRPVLVDPGFHCYNGPKAWEEHFRKTGAHSTVRIDGRDQAAYLGKMAWSHTYTAMLEAFDLAAPDPWAIGVHDGYRDVQGGPVIHRRAVWVRRRGYIVLCDLLEGIGLHQAEFNLQFAPGTLCIDGDGATYGDLVTVHWTGTSPLAGRVEQGGPSPDQGWIAPSLGVKAAAPRLALTASLSLPATVVTIIADAGIDVDAGNRRDRGFIRVAGDNWSELLLVDGLCGPPVRGLESDALMAAWVEREERLEADGQVGGTFQSAAWVRN